MKHNLKIKQGLTTVGRLCGRGGLSVFIFAAFLLVNTSLKGQADGKTLFKQNCGVCHATTDQKLVGPGLLGINEKRKEDWLLKWIKDSQALIASGDAEAKAVFEQYDKQVMTAFGHLSDADIKAILTYVKDPTIGEPPPTVAVNAPVVPVKRPFVIGTAAKIAGVVVLGLVLILGVYLWNINRLITSMGYESLKIRFFDYPVEDILSRHKIIVAILCLALVALGMKACHDSMM